MKNQSQYFWYMAGIATFVVSVGIQTVLFPWLIVVELQAPPERLGLAQMSIQLPALFLVLFGGLLADRLDARSILIVTHIFASLPVFGLATILLLDALTYEWMILFAIFAGTVFAFVQPARDSLLNRVAGDELQKTVTVTMGLSFGGQIFGFIAASFAAYTGAAALLILQGLIYLLGAIAATRLERAPPLVIDSTANLTSRPKQSALKDIREGIEVVIKSPVMWPVMVMLTFMSMFYGGTFIVLNPIIVRDVYLGGAQEISIAFAAFMLGTVVSTVTLVATGGLKSPGRGLLIGLCLGGVCLAMATQQLPFYGYLVCLFLWGICGGVAMSMSRTLMQEAAPAAYRARILSVFSLANLGGLPIGALLLGYCAAWLGPLPSLWVAIIGVWSAAVFIALSSNLAGLKAPNSVLD